MRFSELPDAPEDAMPSRKAILGILLVTVLFAAGMACGAVYFLVDFLQKNHLSSFLAVVQMASLCAVAIVVLREVVFVLRHRKAPPHGLMPPMASLFFWINIGAMAADMTQQAVALPSFPSVAMAVCMWLAVVAGLYFVWCYTKGQGSKAAGQEQAGTP